MGVVGVVETEATVVTVEVVVDEAAPETQEVRVKTTRMVSSSQKVATRAPNIQIFPLESGQAARTISATGKVHFSVPNPPPVPGKISTLSGLINETGTSSATQVHLC